MLDIKVHLSELRDKYKANPRTNKMHALVLGEKGAGKTSILATCPRPVLIHSFDPGGTDGYLLQEGIKEGWIIIDRRFEEDDLYDPTAYLSWEKVYREMQKIRFFESIGTYCIDTLSTLSLSAVWQIMKKENRVPPDMGHSLGDGKLKGMRIQDWGTMLNVMTMTIRSLSSLPCHTIVTCHYAKTRDEVTGAQIVTVMIPGHAKEQVPVLSPEMYVLQLAQTSKGFTRRLLTQNDGTYRATTKWKLDKYEEPDIRALIEKAGLDSTDKEY